MATDVILATNRLQITLDGVLKSSITDIAMGDLQPITVPIYDRSTNPPPILSTQWYVRINLPDGRFQSFPLGSLASHGTWTNNAAGYAIAEAAIYASFP